MTEYEVVIHGRTLESVQSLHSDVNNEHERARRIIRDYMSSMWSDVKRVLLSDYDAVESYALEFIEDAGVIDTVMGELDEPMHKRPFLLGEEVMAAAYWAHIAQDEKPLERIQFEEHRYMEALAERDIEFESNSPRRFAYNIRPEVYLRERG